MRLDSLPHQLRYFLRGGSWSMRKATLIAQRDGQALFVVALGQFSPLRHDIQLDWHTENPHQHLHCHGERRVCVGPQGCWHEGPFFI